MAQVAIEDSGPGFSPEHIEEIFKPFFTTKEGGMGMGLSIVRTIITSHDGRIWAENLPGGGAVVYFELPATTEGVTSTN
jgi:signal transduction histidine kinase